MRGVETRISPARYPCFELALRCLIFWGFCLPGAGGALAMGFAVELLGEAIFLTFAFVTTGVVLVEVFLVASTAFLGAAFGSAFLLVVRSFKN